MTILSRTALAAGTALIALGATPATAVVFPGTVSPVAMTDPSYTQDFDSLASTGTTGTALPDGWQVRELGNSANTSYQVSDGTATAGSAYSFGSAGSTDRALGSLTSGAVNPISFGAFFTNGLGGVIESLSVSYFGEQWRNGTTPSTDSLVFEYSLDATDLTNGSWIGVSALDFTGPAAGTVAGALNGNLDANRVGVSAVIGNLSIADGAGFAIRWTDSTAATGSNDGLAIDDLTLAAALGQVAPAVPEPASWALMIGGFGLVGGTLRRRARGTRAFA